MPGISTHRCISPFLTGDRVGMGWKEKGLDCGQQTEEGEENSKFELIFQIIIKIMINLASRRLGHILDN